METYTIAAAARLVGTAKGKLYQAVRTGRLGAVPASEPGDALTVTAAALQEAGFAVPAAALPPPPAPPATASATAPAPAPVAAAPAITAPAVTPVPEPLAAAPPNATPEQALIAHLERALEQAHAREQRLLDLVAQCTGQRAVTTSGGSEVPSAIPQRYSGSL